MGGNSLQTHLERLAGGKLKPPRAGPCCRYASLAAWKVGLGFLVPHPDVSFRDKETQRLYLISVSVDNIPSWKEVRAVYPDRIRGAFSSVREGASDVVKP